LAGLEFGEVGVDEEGFVLDDFEADAAEVGGVGGFVFDLAVGSEDGVFVYFFFGADESRPGPLGGFDAIQNLFPSEGATDEGEFWGAGAEAEGAGGHDDGFAIARELVGVGFGPGTEGIGVLFDDLVEVAEGAFDALVDGEDGGVAVGGDLALLVDGDGEFAQGKFGVVAGGEEGECDFDAFGVFHFWNRIFNHGFHGLHGFRKERFGGCFCPGDGGRGAGIRSRWPGS
jgi:hypothetical protein